MLAPLHSANTSQAPVAHFSSAHSCLSIDHFSLAYAGKEALCDLTVSVPRHRVTAFIGPSGAVSRRYYGRLTVCTTSMSR